MVVVGIFSLWASGVVSGDVGVVNLVFCLRHSGIGVDGIGNLFDGQEEASACCTGDDGN